MFGSRARRFMGVRLPFLSPNSWGGFWGGFCVVWGGFNVLFGLFPHVAISPQRL